MYDAVEGRHYATYNGHSICNEAITKNPKKCAMDSGSLWFDGDDSKTPADFTVGFRACFMGVEQETKTLRKLSLIRFAHS